MMLRNLSLVIPTRERSETGEPALSEAEGNLLPAGNHHRPGRLNLMPSPIPHNFTERYPQPHPVTSNLVLHFRIVR